MIQLTNSYSGKWTTFELYDSVLNLYNDGKLVARLNRGVKVVTV